MLVPDGVYLREPGGSLGFHQLPEPPALLACYDLTACPSRRHCPRVMARLIGRFASKHTAGMLLATLLVATSSGCRNREKRTHASPTVASSAPADARLSRPHFDQVPITVSTVAPYLAEQIADAGAQHERVLVYVGASWCEPCQRFHRAVEAGELDELLANTRFVEFDADVHTASLNQAGYAVEYIPVIAVPGADGRSSGRQLSGSIKGPDAVRKDLVPRLRALLEAGNIE